MSIMHVAVRSEFCGWHETEVPSTELSHAERAKIHELLDAQQTLMAPLNEDNVYVVRYGHSFKYILIMFKNRMLTIIMHFLLNTSLYKN